MNKIKPLPYTQLHIGQKYFFVFDHPHGGAYQLGEIENIDSLQCDEDYVHIALKGGTVFINPTVYPAWAYNEPWIMLMSEQELAEEIQAKHSS